MGVGMAGAELAHGMVVCWELGTTRDQSQLYLDAAKAREGACHVVGVGSDDNGWAPHTKRR